MSCFLYGMVEYISGQAGNETVLKNYWLNTMGLLR